jgi:hypothetical protein
MMPELICGVTDIVHAVMDRHWTACFLDRFDDMTKVE